ncbi:hypothetical protein B0H13DRAFT_1905442 [Mycena leptocephala]|nr:hypothetical protein B0H13DRAFT_1905442 [Mycena leptocephala]
MAFDVLSVLLSASPERLPFGHMVSVMQCLGLPSASCDSRETFLTEVGSRRCVVVGNHASANPARPLFENVDKLPKGSLVSLAQSHSLKVCKPDSKALLKMDDLRTIIRQHLGTVTNLHPEKEIIWHKTYEARKEQSRKSALLVPVQSASTSSTEQTDREGGISDGTAFRGISQRLETAIRDVDMQLAAHGLECDLAEDNIMVRLPDNVAAGDVTTWTAVFLTYTLAVLEIPDDYTGRSYILNVLKVDAMYKNMD